MKPIITVTLNSSIDVQWEVDELLPIRKLRSSEPLQFPGGGGINVSRVIKALGGQTIAIHTAGWFTGQFFREMVETHGLLTRTIPIKGATRSSATIFERSSGHEFRITPPGPELTENEWRACLDALFEYEADYVVLTGSLPLGVPNDFYARATRIAKDKGVRVILDTSGRALFESLKAGVYLVKPSLRELEHLVGEKARTEDDQVAICQQIVDDGRAELVALTLGADGALLVGREETIRLPSPDVDVRSAVGAGDSFVAGMTLGLAVGMPPGDAFRLAVATGAASVMNAGSDLAQREDVERLFREIAGIPLTLKTH